MQQVITAKLKLLATPEQQQLLRQTQLAYRDALNYVSRYAFEHGKTANTDRLQKGTYREIRVLFNLPSQMACNVPRQVAATYRGLWTKLKQNLAHRKAGHTKKRYNGLDKPPKYVSPTVTYNYGYDYSFKSGQQISVLTLQGRVVLSYQGYHRHAALIQQGATIGAARLWYDKPHKQFYVLVCLELDLPEPTPAILPDVVGVDVGMRYLATTATITNQSHFYAGKRVKTQADRYARLQKPLQKKGTRSATRRKKPGKGTEPVSPKAHRANRHASKWAFAELHSTIAYKAALSGSSLAIKVDADYTSQTCPLCGYTSKQNRPKKGLLFICRNKHCPHRQRTGQPYTLHADLVGARNIAMRTLLTRQDWVRTGVLSVRPDVSDSETKAARLARYAELRWSSDTSLSLEG